MRVSGLRSRLASQLLEKREAVHTSSSQVHNRLAADLRLVARSGGRWRERRRPRKPARGQAVDRPYVFGCALDREGSESPIAPQSLPFGSILRGGGSDSVPVRSRSSSSRCLRSRDPRAELGTLSGTRAAAGTRCELGGNPSGACVAADDAAGKVVPRLDLCGVPPPAVRFRIGSITYNKGARRTTSEA
jgi:hypothetical protein